MIKNLLRLLASSATFVAVMLVANIAIAAPQIDDNSSIVTVDKVSSSLVNLNIISSSLESNNSLLDHLGCSCGICTQGTKSDSSEL